MPRIAPSLPPGLGIEQATAFLGPVTEQAAPALPPWRRP
jgi:hypothetical protein